MSDNHVTVERTPLGIITKVDWNTETRTLQLVVEMPNGDWHRVEGRVIDSGSDGDS